MNNIYELLQNQKETSIILWSIYENKDGTVNISISGGNKRPVSFKKKNPEDTEVLANVVTLLLEYKQYEKWLEKNA